ncbi:MAG: isopentenyl-diphosphate Delta-isomerase [bacterium]
MTNQILINLLDTEGNRIGSIEKLEAHKLGVLHEAFSIFIFNDEGKLLLQKRNKEKYHSGGLWTNTCCGHANYEEEINVATHRRLQEEMGFDTELKKIFNFTYKVELENQLFENETDHVFFGKSESTPIPDPEEVEDFKWIAIQDLIDDANANPDAYTEWLKIILKDQSFLDEISKLK